MGINQTKEINQYCNNSKDCLYYGAIDYGQVGSSNNPSLGTVATVDTYGTACCNNSCQWMTYEKDQGPNGNWSCPSKENPPMDQYCHMPPSFFRTPKIYSSPERMNDRQYGIEMNKYIASMIKTGRLQNYAKNCRK